MPEHHNPGHDWTGGNLPTFVTHLECANCGQRYDANQIHNLCTACQKPLWVRYDLDAVKKHFPKQALADRPQTLWRYRELLPVREHFF